MRRNHKHSHHGKASGLTCPQPPGSRSHLQRASFVFNFNAKVRSCESPGEAKHFSCGLRRFFTGNCRARGKWLRGLDSNQDIQLQRLACYRLHHPGSGLPCSTYWRRGWDSNPEPPIKTRNLLISIAYQDARTARNAGVGYKRGTKNVSPEKRSLAVPENLFYAHCCAQVSNTAYCIPPQFRPVRFRGPNCM